MIPLFLLLLFSGVLLGSVAMWRGVERKDALIPTVDEFGRELPSQPVSLLLPGAVGALVCTGAVGYVLAKHGSLHIVATVVVAVLAGVGGAVAAMAVVTRWAVPSALASPEDLRYVLQGTPGKVVSDIARDGTGQVSYEANGQLVTMQARSVDGSKIPAGSDVVLERLEDGVAFVEPWSVVEARM